MWCKGVQIKIIAGHRPVSSCRNIHINNFRNVKTINKAVTDQNGNIEVDSVEEHAILFWS